MKKPNLLPTLEYLNECFELLSDGSLIWKRRPETHFESSGKTWNSRFPGKNAAIPKGDGYFKVCINNKRYAAHRIVFYMSTGIDPGISIVDHADGCKSNNSPENLRLASYSQNAVNFKGARSDNVLSGRRGVGWNRHNKKWEAWVTRDGRRVYLGIYVDLEEAARVADAARIEQYGEFYALG